MAGLDGFGGASWVHSWSRPTLEPGDAFRAAGLHVLDVGDRVVEFQIVTAAAGAEPQPRPVHRTDDRHWNGCGLLRESPHTARTLLHLALIDEPPPPE